MSNALVRSIRAAVAVNPAIESSDLLPLLTELCYVPPGERPPAPVPISSNGRYVINQRIPLFSPFEIYVVYLLTHLLFLFIRGIDRLHGCNKKCKPCDLPMEPPITPMR